MKIERKMYTFNPNGRASTCRLRDRPGFYFFADSSVPMSDGGRISGVGLTPREAVLDLRRTRTVWRNA